MKKTIKFFVTILSITALITSCCNCCKEEAKPCPDNPNVQRQGQQEKIISTTFCDALDKHRIDIDEAAKLIHNFQVLYRNLNYYSAGGVLNFATKEPGPEKLNLNDYYASLFHLCLDTSKPDQIRMYVAVDKAKCITNSTTHLDEASDDVQQQYSLASKASEDLKFFSDLSSWTKVKEQLIAFKSKDNNSVFLLKGDVIKAREQFQKKENYNYPSYGAFFKTDVSIKEINDYSGSNIIRYYFGYDTRDKHKIKIILVGADATADHKNIYEVDRIRETSRPKP